MGWYAQTKRACAVAGAVMLAAALCTSAASAHPGHANEGKRSRAAAPPHVMVIMMENTDYSQAMGSAQMPYLNDLVHQYAGFTQAYGWQYPSLPNYVELFAGSTVGINADCDPGDKGCTGLSHERFTDQLETQGISWHAYYQDDVSGCDDNPDDFFHGNYDVEHNMFAYFADFGQQCSHLSNFDPLYADLSSAQAPDFDFVVPDLDNDGGDNGTMASGDAWLAQNIPHIMKTAWYRKGGQIVVLYDTGYGNSGGVNGSTGGQLPPVAVVSAHTAGMGLRATPLNTAGVLRSLEAAYGVPYIGDAANPANGSLGPALLAGWPTGPSPKPSSEGAVVSVGQGPPAVDASSQALTFNGIDRIPGGATIEVGENSKGVGVLLKGSHVVPVPGTTDLLSVSCTAAGTCWAVGLGRANGDEAAVVKIVDGRPAKVTQDPAFYGLYGIDCPAGGQCEAVGYDTSDIADAVTTITGGQPGPPAEVPGGGEWLNAVSCPTATECYATGLVDYTASIVPIASGVPQKPITVPNAWYLNAIDCTGVGNCTVAGESGNAGEGFVDTLVDGAIGQGDLVPGTENLYGVGCAIDGNCLISGASQVGAGAYSHGVVLADTAGTLGAPRAVPGTNGLGQAVCGLDDQDCETVDSTAS
jgi:phosphatidylinositol-3-phosphatase